MSNQGSFHSTIAKSISKAGLVSIVLALISTSSWADAFSVEFLDGRGDDDGAKRRARVEAMLTPDKGYVGFYRSGSDTGLYHQWATFLLDIEASDTQGRPLELVYQPHGRWKVKNWRSGTIKLRYTMALQHDRFPNDPGDDELAAAHPYGVMWTTRALLLEGAPSSDVRVSFNNLPENWKLSTPWRRVSSEEGWVFAPRNTSDLLDSAFVAGEHFQRDIPVTGGLEGKSGGVVRIALGPPIQHFEGAFSPLFEAYLNYYADLMNAPPEDTILVIALDASFLGGGVVGRTISLSLTPDLPPEAAMPAASYMVSHEGFHLWNSQWRRDGDPELEWLVEGSSEYYGFLAGVRLGFFGEDVFFDQLAEKYSSYLKALKSGASIIAAADDKLGSEENYNMIYGGGMTLMTLLDLDLRAATKNVRSADDLVRTIHAKHVGTNDRKLTLRELTRLLGRDFGYKFEQTLRTSVRGTSPLDLSAALETIGYTITVEEIDGSFAAKISPVESPTENQSAALAAWKMR